MAEKYLKANNYLKRWRRLDTTAIGFALYSSDDGSDDETPQISSPAVDVDTVTANYDDCSALSSPKIDSEIFHILEYVISSESDAEFESDSEADNAEQPSFVGDVASWASRNSITHRAINELLAIFKEHVDYYVPKDARTLLRTPRTTPVMMKCGGQYIYFGIGTSVLKELACNISALGDGNLIELVVNVDGLPIHRSSSREFWPILCSFGACTPFLVALYYGRGKPNSVSEFLKDFLEEYAELKDKGLECVGRKVFVSIKAFICDAPARAMLKCVKGHTALQACELYVIQGVKKEGRTVLYSKFPCALRTDEQFKRFAYEDQHQVQKSPLIPFGINCIQSFPLDYMHIICLGVMRRMLYFWKGAGPLHCRLSNSLLTSVSEHLVWWQKSFR